jgi:hypothetical protein
LRGCLRQTEQLGTGPVRIEALPGGRFVATNVALRALIQNVYRLQPF